MEIPRPTRAHRQLERLVGDWRGQETMHPSQWDPAGGVAEGVSPARLAVSGFAVVVDYEQIRDGEVTFTGHGVYSIDEKTQEVVMHWFDCMSPGPEVFRGKFVGDELILVSKGPMGEFRSTNVYTGEEMHNKMEMSQDGKQWTTLFEGVYRR
ncbi:MAG TPA: DUF1579 family protein [Planctomycetota bacterium]